jgi:hypothetical protein
MGVFTGGVSAGKAILSPMGLVLAGVQPIYLNLVIHWQFFELALCYLGGDIPLERI